MVVEQQATALLVHKCVSGKGTYLLFTYTVVPVVWIFIM